MKQRIRILLDDLQLQDVIKGPIVVSENGVHIDVERDIEHRITWHPMVEKIVAVMCAMDPESGSGTIGAHDHSHDPAAEECYWASTVGPHVAKLFADEPRQVINHKLLVASIDAEIRGRRPDAAFAHLAASAAELYMQRELGIEKEL